MKNLYIMGSAGSGKTAMAVGLALKFKQEGLRINYFKPVGISTTTGKPDEDAVLMKEILAMKTPLEVIVPTTASPFYLSRGNRSAELLGIIRDAYNTIASESDIVIIDSAIFPHIMGTIGLDAPSLAYELKANVLYLINVKNDYSLDQTVFFNNYIRCKGVPVLGNIFTHVPRPIWAKIEGVYKPLLDENGFRTLGIVPRITELSSPSVAQVYELLGGELLTGEQHLDLLVEDIMVGAMTIESALTFMRRSNNKVFITGGDRADMALAALETSTAAIILTGGLYPDVKVISRAMEKGVPVLLVHYDTYTTIEKLSELTGRITANDKESIKKAVDNVERYCDWKTILNSLR
ncbi:DRTGG domain protein [Desulfotomaculum nigrificans CO-1-SRB]|uniref:DRTGG domain protein n=1 Tax=Desulfotomaculum nigrificans (strain DSM 14880 / VKM B-2319 / CO-1-SRB) TaxID=868595 RepID=F6B341_DESCC|nr:DRTGG domain-containing protein [Desulfotomaculum nigrificans]AEF93945.1 DRTGG domain protein [Desulfotomaculum nigrificans CO-1-SRB]